MRAGRVRRALGCGAALLAIALALDPGAAISATTVTYTYDQLGRVTQAVYSDGTTITYSYDAAGNRTQQIVTCNTCVLTAHNISANIDENSTANPITPSITGGTPTSVAVSAQAAHGTATASGTSITYTPTSNFAGADTFQYTASNSGGTSAPATASLTVIAKPIANNVSATVAENSSNDPITLNITGGTATSVTVSTQAAHGTATASGTSISYTPTPNYAGSDSFAYTATDYAGTSSPATASLTVLAPPIANNVGASVGENSSNDPITLNITGGAAASVAVSTQATHGTATATGTTIKYTPTASYLGPDTFQYKATNIAGTSAAATASITVTFAPISHTYTGSGTETVPTGASSVTITMWSGGAAGGRDSLNGGGGGGGGCQAIQTIAVTGGNTFTYNLGGAAGGRSTNGTGQSGTASSVTGTVSGGSVSLSTSVVATGGKINTNDGVGATCAGGTTNTNGFGGNTSGGNGGGVGGGIGGQAAGDSGSDPGGGGAGAIGGTSGSGAEGEVIFSYQ